jgi:hypothetical protein
MHKDKLNVGYDEKYSEKFNKVKWDKYVLKTPRGYVETLCFPISDSVVTDDINEAYRFYDREWLQEKLRYYGSHYKIEEVSR